jgi:predicted membrane-bound spermidine synthase
MSRRPLVGIFLLSGAGLLLEIALTRILAVVLYSHFAFLIVSTALFGLGLAGVQRALRPGARTIAMAWRCLGFAGAVVVCLAILDRVSLRLEALAQDPSQALRLLVYYLGLTAPFYLAGTVIVDLLAQERARIGRVYGSDLAGAALGAIAVVPLFFVCSGQVVLLVAALTGLAAGWALAPRAAAGQRRALLLGGLAAVALLPFADRLFSLRDHPYKRSYYRDVRDGKIERSGWNPITKVDVARVNDAAKNFWIDGGSNQSLMLRNNGNYRGARNAKRWFALPYTFQRAPKAYIVGPGGGTEVLTALAYGATRVVAVELDPTIVREVTTTYSEFNGGIFLDPRVELVCDEGRSHLRRLDQRFDIIQQVANATPAALASGAINLSETYLLTVEAFHEYWDHLEPEGVLAIYRWGSLKLFATALQMLRERGVANPELSLAALRGELGGVTTREALLLKKGAFRPLELGKIRQFARRHRAAIFYLPRDPRSLPWFRALIEARAPQQVYRRLAFDIEPPTDDRPFFNHFVRWRDLLGPPAHPVPELPFLGTQTDRGQLILLFVLAESLVLAGLFLVAPLMVLARAGTPAAARWRTIGYFMALGAGFILIEIALIQRFTLFIGVPAYTITTVLAVLLVGAGLGSMLSDRLVARRWALPAALVAVALAVVLVTAAAALLFPVYLSSPLSARIGVSAALLLPLGLLLGLPFPLGLDRLGRSQPRLIPWAWGINGYATVLGSTLAVILALAGGFSMVFGWAAAIYLAAVAVQPRMSQVDGGNSA